MHAGALYAAFGLVSAVLHARATGHGRVFEVAQADAAIAWNWLHIEGAVAYERPEDEVTGSTGDGVRRAIGFDDFADAVRYQYYETADGHVLFMASERKFWRNFCEAVGRLDLFDSNPGREVADHALGNTALRAALVDIFRTRTTQAWMAFGEEIDVPIAFRLQRGFAAQGSACPAPHRMVGREHPRRRSHADSDQVPGRRPADPGEGTHRRSAH